MHCVRLNSISKHTLITTYHIKVINLKIPKQWKKNCGKWKQSQFDVLLLILACEVIAFLKKIHAFTPENCLKYNLHYSNMCETYIVKQAGIPQRMEELHHSLILTGRKQVLIL